MFQNLKRFIGILKQKSNCAIPLDTPEEKDTFEIAGAYYQNFSDISNEIWESLKKNKYIKEIVDI